MITVGIDVGNENAKVVILRDETVLSQSITPVGTQSIDCVAQNAFNDAITRASVPAGDIRYIAVTGSGAPLVSLPQSKRVSEVVCLCKGINYLSPSVRIILSIGAIKLLAVKCKQGKPINFAVNDRCAATTGRCLNMVAQLLGIDIDEMGNLFASAKGIVEIQNTCAVFIESEIISLIHMKMDVGEIVAGVLRGLAQRIYPLLTRLGLENDIALVGGGANNSGLVKAIEELIGHDVIVPPNADFVSALGAALFVQERGEAAS